MRPRAATLRPPAFQRPVLGYCVHILSLFVHLLQGPIPAAPLPRPSRPDPDKSGAGPLSGHGHAAPSELQIAELGRAGTKAPGQQRPPRAAPGLAAAGALGQLPAALSAPCTPRGVLALLLSPSAPPGEGQQLANRGNCQAASDTQAAKAL